VALTWVACESGSSSPYRVLENGPWWRAVAVDGTHTPREPYDPTGVCSTCSLSQEKCRQVWRDDHPYISVTDYAKTVIRDPERIRRILEAVRGERQIMREPSHADPVEEHRIEHEDCDQAIDEALAEGKNGRAEYLSARCDTHHADQAARDAIHAAKGGTDTKETQA
jgi:hypothetical protein